MNISQSNKTNVSLTNLYFPSIYVALLERDKIKGCAHFLPWYNFCNINNMKFPTMSQRNYLKKKKKGNGKELPKEFSLHSIV